MQFYAQQRYRTWRETGERGAAGSYRSGSQGASSQGASRTSGTVRNAELARCYAALEVPYGSDLPTVREAYKRLVKKYHPDRFATDPDKMAVATKLVRELNDAYERLRRHLGA